MAEPLEEQLPPDPFVLSHLSYLRQCGFSHRTVYQRNRSLIRLAAVLPVPLMDATAPMLAEWRARPTGGGEGVEKYFGDVRPVYARARDQGIRDDKPAPKPPGPRDGPRPPQA